MKLFLTALFLLSAVALFAAPAKKLDRIVAVVDEQIILESELNEMAYFSFQNTGKAVPVGTPEFETFRRKILEGMIEDKLLLKQAEAESISVSSEEILKQRDAQIDGYIQKLGSKEALEAELKKSYGLTLPRLKKQLEEQIRDQMMKMQLAQAIRQKMNITREDVERFYKDYRDSLPKEKESIHLAHIQKDIVPAASAVKLAQEKIRKIENELSKGGPFPELAKNYSEDPSASQGGDLGFFEKGLLDPAFEKAAFALGAGEVSGMVRSARGFHLIKLEERKDNAIRVRHILAMVQPTTADTAAAMALCDSLSKGAQTDSLFKGAAEQYSDDKLTKGKGGDLGWLGEETLGEEYRQALGELQAGQNSGAVLIGGSYHVFRLLEKMDERPLSLQEDYESLKNLATNFKLKQELSLRTDKIKKKVFVDNRLASVKTAGDE